MEKYTDRLEGEVVPQAQFEYESAMEEEQSGESYLPVAFPLDDVSEDNEVYKYVQSVRMHTDEANQKYTPIDSNLDSVMNLVLTINNSRNVKTSPQKVSQKTEIDRWREETCLHFNTVVKNLEYLRDRNPQPTQKSKRLAFHYIVKTEPKVEYLMALQFVDIEYLMNSVCCGLLQSPNPLANGYAACLWLYSLLAVYKVRGGSTHFELLSDINSVVERLNYCLTNAQTVEAKALRVLQTILVGEYGQKHLQLL